MTEIRKDLGIYIHIPFCIKKCSYCDFLSGPANDDIKKAYTDALIKEIKLKSIFGITKEIKTIFIGGGTPSCLPDGMILKIAEAIKESFSISSDVEFTIECNPGTLDINKLVEYKRAGINRLSIGLQSADNEELKLLGRIHTFEEFEKNYNLCRQAGFNNINIDLMSGLPYQTEEKFVNTLKRILLLEPEHISAYSLIIEEGTKFYDIYGNEAGEKYLPDEETDRKIYHVTKKVLEEKGYKRYEISNYAKEGFICRHNYAYWERKDYIGFGCGAASLYRFDEIGYKDRSDAKIEKYKSAEGRQYSKIDYMLLNMLKYSFYNKLCNNKSENNISDVSYEAVRFKNIMDINKYIDELYKRSDSNAEKCEQIKAITLKDEFELLDLKAAMEEFMFLGLRKTNGISKKEFKRNFEAEFNSVYNEVTEKLKKEGLIEENGDYIRLTDRGTDLSNYAMSEYILD